VEQPVKQPISKWHEQPRPLTLEWKVAAAADAVDGRCWPLLLQRFTASAKLRLECHGGWNRPAADQWPRILGGANLAGMAGATAEPATPQGTPGAGGPACRGAG